MERQACRAASDQSACKVTGGAMDGRGLPRPWTERMSWGTTPTFTFMHLADAFIQSDLQLHSGYKFFVSICVPWESNPQPFALLMQCSTTEPHRNTKTTSLVLGFETDVFVECAF